MNIFPLISSINKIKGDIELLINEKFKATIMLLVSCKFECLKKQKVVN